MAESAGRADWMMRKSNSASRTPKGIVEVQDAQEKPRQSAQGGKETLMVQVGALAPVVRDAQKKVDELRRQHGISDLDAGHYTRADD
jgi:uncharacterized protein involved in exopolysaccharide biosynthesis